MNEPSSIRASMLAASVLAAAACLVAAASRVSGGEDGRQRNDIQADGPGEEFFERRIRPVLAEHCCACHGEKKQESGLRLDQPQAALEGGENGPVIAAGDPEASRLVQAIRYLDDTLQMPPDGRLSDEAIRDLEEWIRQGAPWPQGAGVRAETGTDAWRSHWAFQPIGDPEPPAVKDTAWPRTPIDQFILARLEAAGLAPSPAADRRTLLRRLTFGLTGLAPTPQEIDDFVNDPSDEALSRAIDRLLASPAYGQRWGRHWLDVARYADNKGYKFFGSDEFHGYTFRDWVIQAFNDDLPYDEFILQQLAADRLLAERGIADDTRSLAAMGYLTVGRRFLEDLHDIIDDRIDVVTRGILGLTVTCARCHDHKYDPIPTADYYSLYGVFAGSMEKTRTLYSAASQTEAEREHECQLAAREAELDQYFEKRHAELLAAFRSQVAQYLLEGHKAQSLPPTDRFMFVEEPDKLSQLVIGNWRAFLDRTERGHDPVFAAWHAFADLPPSDFAAKAPAIAEAIRANADPARPINARVASLFEGAAPASLEEVADRYGQLLAGVERQWKETLSEAAAAGGEPPARFEDDALEPLRRVLYGPLSPVDVPITDVEFLVGRPGQAQINELRKKIADFVASSSLRPPRAMILDEAPALCLHQPRVFQRGKPSNLGPQVPRQFLAVLSGEGRKPFSQGSGRLELARAIVDRRNPLTARVMVNRVWLAHFGSALVPTPSDFGLRSEPPSHPELLDWLATRFMEQGWSIKQLHRLIVLSSVYQQRSDDRTEASRIDPGNRLLWRMNRRRLDFESLRDALLAVAGQLDAGAGGPPVDIVNPPYSKRRTVYGYVDRTNLPGLFRTFDFAIPDTHSPQRYTTTVPQQALFLMNNPFVIEQARHLAARGEIAGEANPRRRIERLYAICFGRPPDPDEIELGLGYIHSGSERRADPELTPWERYCHALLLMNEFVMLD
ncbi:MAG: PSD1 and planctomycete cytochrome C domain-containing protein [Pirellulales bacterium]